MARFARMRFEDNIFRTAQGGENGSRVRMIALFLWIFGWGGSRGHYLTIPPLLRLGLFVTSTTSVIISLDSESRLRQITSLACPTSFGRASARDSLLFSSIVILDTVSYLRSCRGCTQNGRSCRPCCQPMANSGEQTPHF